MQRARAISGARSFSRDSDSGEESSLPYLFVGLQDEDGGRSLDHAGARPIVVIRSLLSSDSLLREGERPPEIARTR
jgi:hypothetical protein